MLTLHEILQRFDTPKSRGKEYRTRCPAHDDRTPSLDIAEGDTGIVFRCRAGCETRDILTAAGLTWADVLPPRSSTDDYAAVHDYRDAAGVLRYQVVQLHTPAGAKKQFEQRRPGGNGAGAWIWDLKGVTKLPFRLPELAGQVRVFVCEGEKDANRLWSLGLPATCNSGGAGQWGAVESAALKVIGVQRVVLLQDFDAPGVAHVAKAATHLTAAGISSLTLPPFPGVPETGDVSDWLDLGHTVADLEALILGAAPRVIIPELDPTFLADAVDVIREGQRIAEQGIQFTVDGMIPAYGMLGFLVAFAKVGKTTLGQALAAAVAMGQPFLHRVTTRARVLIIAAEDPPEYTAYLARTLVVDPGWLTFSRAPLQLTADGLARIVGTVQTGGYGLVLISSWQAVIRGLVKDENDNAGAVNIVETVKASTRLTQIPWLIDAHSGKGEDQDDGADPSKALRGASGAAGAADYTLSLRYADGTFGNKRRLSGKGRFVNFAPLTLDYDLTTGRYDCLGDASRVAVETTWRLIEELGALTDTAQTVADIARRISLQPAGSNDRFTKAQRRQVTDALKDRAAVIPCPIVRRGQETIGYRLRIETDDCF